MPCVVHFDSLRLEGASSQADKADNPPANFFPAVRSRRRVRNRIFTGGAVNDARAVRFRGCSLEEHGNAKGRAEHPPWIWESPGAMGQAGLKIETLQLQWQGCQQVDTP